MTARHRLCGGPFCRVGASRRCRTSPPFRQSQRCRARAAKSGGLPEEEVHEWSATGENYTGERDFAATWKSIAPHGAITVLTLYKIAMEHGWRPERQSTHRQTKTLPRPAKRARATHHASLAGNVWARCKPATDAHPYIEKKRGRPEGLRVVPDGDPQRILGERLDGWLAVPAWSPQGELRTLQFISPEGRKLNLGGASFGDGMYTVGALAESPCIYVVEGLGQTRSCWQATGHAAVCSFGAGRMAAVAMALHKQYSNAKLVIVADRGKEAEAEGIARAVSGAWVAMPDDKPENYDANDYARDNDADALGALLDKAKEPEPVTATPEEPNGEPGFRFLEPAELMGGLRGTQYRIKPFLEDDSIAVLFGASGTYKSFVLIDMLLCVAHGIDFHGMPVKQGAVFYIAGEGQGGIGRRVLGWLNAHGFRELRAPFYTSSCPARLMDAEHAAQVKDAVGELARRTGQKPAVIAIDTLARNMGEGDENSDLGTFVQHLDEYLRVQFAACVAVVHHTGHAAGERERGDSKLPAAVDCRIRAERIDEYVTLHHAKTKDGAAWPPVTLRSRAVLLVGLPDNFGQDSSTLVPERAETPPERDAKGKVTSADARLFALLQRLTARPGAMSAKRADLLHEARAEGIEISDDTIDRQLARLRKAGLVRKVGNGVYRPAEEQQDAECAAEFR